jgi:hypothetical protein
MILDRAEGLTIVKFQTVDVYQEVTIGLTRYRSTRHKYQKKAFQKRAFLKKRLALPDARVCFTKPEHFFAALNRKIDGLTMSRPPTQYILSIGISQNINLR